jgi:hypothetical protein
MISHGHFLKVFGMKRKSNIVPSGTKIALFISDKNAGQSGMTGISTIIANAEEDL